MKQEIFNYSYSSRAKLFGYLIVLQLLIAGIVTAVIAMHQDRATTLLISMLVAVASGILLLVLVFSRNLELVNNLERLLISRPGYLLPFLSMFALIGFLFTFNPEQNVLWSLSPLLATIWAIGMETLIIFPVTRANHQNNSSTSSKKLAAIGMVLAYGIIFIPSRILSVFDGVPWDTPLEFIFAILVLPLACLVGWRFFANRITLCILGFLMIVKIALQAFLPQSGLGVLAYPGQDSSRNGLWKKSYSTLINPAYTQVAQMPFTNIREFPIEWVNSYGFDAKEFQVTLGLNGVGYLKEDERLAFIVTGARQTQIQITDAATQNTMEAVIVESAERLNNDLYNKIPQTSKFTLTGWLTFKRFGDYQISPVIWHADGTISSAFAPPRIWISEEAWKYSYFQLEIFRTVLNLIGILLAVIAVIAILTGCIDLFRTGEIPASDLYLALTALPVFYIAELTPKKDLNMVVFYSIGLLTAIKVVELVYRSHTVSGKDILLSVGIAFLLMFLVLDVDILRKVTIFPQGQDGLEYQVFARNIFVNGDVLLTHSPPRAYKVLFPYVVGLLHFLFGQSSSAQLFVSAWFALFSGIAIIQIMNYYQVVYAITYTAAVLSLLILCLPSSYIFYFRFGLIEPIAIFCLLSTVLFAIHRRTSLMFISGMLTVLFRLDYLSAVFAAVLLTAPSITGTTTMAWIQLMDWIKSQWKFIVVYALALVSPPLLIIWGYFTFTSHYVLNSSDTRQHSIASVLEGVFRVIVGGSIADLQTKFSQNPADVLLLVLPLVLGFLTAMGSAWYRRGWFEHIDLRWALFTLGLLPAYLFVRPTGYDPRFSLPLLPADLVILGLLIHSILKLRRAKSLAIESQYE